VLTCFEFAAAALTHSRCFASAFFYHKGKTAAEAAYASPREERGEGAQFRCRPLFQLITTLRQNYAASTRRKPFHIAVAAPEVKTGRIRTS